MPAVREPLRQVRDLPQVTPSPPPPRWSNGSRSASRRCAGCLSRWKTNWRPRLPSRGRFGVALACKMKGEGRVVAGFCGDGAINEGIAYEAMNMASLWALPLVFACENNQYGEYTAARSVTAGPGLCARAEAMGIPAARVDGMDVCEVRHATASAVARARH